MPRCSISCPFPQKQSGVVLLAFALVLIVGTSYLLVEGFNANLIQVKQTVKTRLVLQQAKQALIGYAVTYPDITNAVFGPGYLPCPNIDNEYPNDGVAGGSCSFTGNTTIGRFPYKTLEMEELRDATGERLWYALSENFKYGTGKTIPMNSQGPMGDLTVDGTGDIVAILIAPGTPLDDQNRDRDEYDIVDEIDNYLEGDNSDFDTNYESVAGTNTNDQLIYITRQELLFAVEKRVLGEVFQSINTYQTTYSAYPWLSPFTDPGASAFRAQLVSVPPKDGWQGHIPFHWSDDPNSIEEGGTVTGRNPFVTDISLRWDNISGVTPVVNNYLTAFGISTVSDACLYDINDCDEGNKYPELPPLTFSDIDCVWSNKDTADCITNSTTIIRTGSVASGSCPPGTLTRTYTIDFPAFSGTGVPNDPTESSYRTRNVSLTNNIPSKLNAIQIQDIYDGMLEVVGICFGPFSGLIAGDGSIDFNNNNGTIEINNIKYDLDVDDGEIPEWFVENKWHELVYIAYPEVENLPGGTTTCEPDDTTNPLYPCLSLVGAGDPDNSNRGIVMIAGDIITSLAQDRITSPDMDDYFEEDNFDEDQVYQTYSLYELKATFDTANPVNDQIRVLTVP